jgi:peroxiredoxin
MAQLEPLKAEIEAISASLAFIAAEKRGGMFKPEAFFGKNPSSFPFLLDEDRAVTKAYGVYQKLRLDAINIARPATLVVDRQGVIRYIYVGNSQHDRAPIEPVIAAARQAAK